ncbi:MAG: hypothetical protein Q7J10_10920 [Methanosarcinaceae archaeon]|nr:hypothetical protein [Methanosarcinaceae archaeon]
MSARNISPAVFIIFLIITIIITSIVCLVPTAAAYDFRDENIWIYQGSFEIGVGERADTGDHVIKVHAIDMNGAPASATLLVYRNKVYKESFFVDSLANNEHVYDEALLIKVLDIKDEKVSLEIYKQEYEHVWITDIDKIKLVSGEEITSGDYTIKIIGFSEDGVAVSISNDGMVVQDIYNTGFYKKYNDEFIVKAVYLNQDRKEVFMETYRPGAPNIELSMTAEQDLYDPNTPIEYDVVVRNTGTVPIRGVILETSVTSGIVDNPVQTHHIIEPSLSQTFKVNVIPPKSPLGTSFTVKTNVTGYDYKGVSYTNSTTINTSINSYIAVEKSVAPDELFLNKMVYGKQETTRINLTIHNMADFSTSVNVYDELPQSFLPLDMASLEWTVVLEPDSSTVITYQAMPTMTGNFTLSPASVEWKKDGDTFIAQTIGSQNVIDVHGTRVFAEKLLSRNVLYVGENTDVRIILTNIGDDEAEVSFSDTIPMGVKVIAGESGWNGNLVAGERKDLIYTIQIEEADITALPGVEVSFVDSYDNHGSTISNTVNLYVDEIIKSEETSEIEAQTPAIPTIPTPESDLSRWGAAGFMISSFIMLLCIIAIAPITAYLLITRVIS